MALAAVGLALTALAVHWGARLGTASAPFVGRYRLKVDAGTLLAPAVAAAVLLAAARGLADRMRWRVVLLAAYLSALAWALSLAAVDGGNGLAAPVTNAGEYLRDVPAVHDRPGGFIAGFVAASGEHATATRQHPPGPVLLLWAVQRLGVHRPAAIGLLLTIVGCLSVPLVLVAVRSLCGAVAARRLAPVLVLAPYAVWVAVSMDAITATLGAAMVTAGVLASEQHRRGPPAVAWAAASGLLLGVAALFSYAAPWLALSVICVYFVRRRALLNTVTGAAALLPLVLAQLVGFVWTDGLTAAQADFSIRVEPMRSAVVWGCLSLVVLVLACGPAIVASARKIRRTPGWPFLVGAAVAVGFAVAAGLARGEMEHAWVPYFPWLLVAAVAPEQRGGEPARAPLWLAATGALGAIALEAILHTAW
ncbi:MAG: hypothetical protein DLM59_10715 [Pseudonocardiales bacterium]|nr:MAG: hypothetical protein DLM59_10715 [Pseudonocardiales bacterium]